MSTSRISDKAGWVNSSQLPRGPNGRALCRRCNSEVPKGRRAWCGDKCVDEHRIESDPSFARSRVEKRDDGVCLICSLDCNRLKEILHRKYDRSYRARVRRLFYFVSGRPRTGKFATCRSLWEMDHIKPVVEGGGACGLDNLRTLCVWCHNRVTAELRGRIARRNRTEKNTQLSLLGDDT